MFLITLDTPSVVLRTMKKITSKIIVKRGLNVKTTFALFGRKTLRNADIIDVRVAKMRPIMIPIRVPASPNRVIPTVKPVMNATRITVY